MSLIDTMRPNWDTALGSYPGDPYHHNNFRKFYSDHHPVVKVLVPRGAAGVDVFRLQGARSFGG